MSSPLQQKALKKVHFLDFIIYLSPNIAILVKREVQVTVRSSITTQFLGTLPDLLCSLSVKPQHSEHHTSGKMHYSPGRQGFLGDTPLILWSLREPQLPWETLGFPGEPGHPGKPHGALNFLKHQRIGGGCPPGFLVCQGKKYFS